MRCVFEGSVRKAGARLRITGQLIDAATATTCGRTSSRASLLDVFDLQDRVATSVVGAIAPRLIAADAELARRKPPEKLEDKVMTSILRGIAVSAQRTRRPRSQALELLRKAISLNPEFALAHIRAAACLLLRPRGIRRWVSLHGAKSALKHCN